MPTIAILGTMDTKGEEHAFVADQIRLRGHRVLIIDTGTLEEPKLKPDISKLQGLMKDMKKGDTMALSFFDRRSGGYDPRIKGGSGREQGL